MQKVLYNLIVFFLIGLMAWSCANKGTPEGGPKDEEPPKIIRTEPENYSTNFNGNEIRIVFNEYIKLKNLQKQLIISPPMNTQPEIRPLGGASKEITIKIFDTLRPNTTYAFNFGNSIEDNNEGNPFTYYRYVFSTGDYIDSLTVSGNIVDALSRNPDTFVNVALYEVDSTFNDSIIYKQTPKYITNTLDSLTTFKIENVKEGNYLLVAMKDKNGDNKFQQKTDKIAFYKSFIQVPTDSLYTLKLFNEELDFNPSRPRLISGEQIAFGYEGDYKNMEIELLSNVPEDFEYRITKDSKTDTLYYWYKPRLEADSLQFRVKHINFEKDYTVRISEQKRDSLTIKVAPTGTIRTDEPFTIFGSTPMVDFDESKISLMDKDSTYLTFTTIFDTINNTYKFYFPKTEDNAYKMTILPQAFRGFFGTEIDTLNYAFKTKSASDFGSVRFILNNASYPLIIQLTDEKGTVKAEQYIESKAKAIDFFNVVPGKYFVRTIYDANGNKKYDTGSYLKKIQPEQVSHFEFGDDGEIRADWGEVITLQFN